MEFSRKAWREREREREKKKKKKEEDTILCCTIIDYHYCWHKIVISNQMGTGAVDTDQ